MIVLTLTGWTGSPSVAMTVSTCPSTLNWAGHTVPKELINRNLYLLPGVIVNTSNGVLVTKPVLGSWKADLLCRNFVATDILLALAWSLTTKWENKLMVIENRMLGRIYGHGKDRKRERTNYVDKAL
jgi:hypothetical protein